MYIQFIKWAISRLVYKIYSYINTMAPNSFLSDIAETNNNNPARFMPIFVVKLTNIDKK